jgi:hypothetical protein
MQPATAFEQRLLTVAQSFTAAQLREPISARVVHNVDSLPADPAAIVDVMVCSDRNNLGAMVALVRYNTCTRAVLFVLLNA